MLNKNVEKSFLSLCKYINIYKLLAKIYIESRKNVLYNERVQAACKFPARRNVQSVFFVSQYGKERIRTP